MTITTGLASLVTLQVGKQSDIATLPSVAFVEPLNDVQIQHDTAKIERAFVRGDGRNVAPIDGKQNASVQLTLAICGLSRATGAEISTPASKQTELTPFFDMLHLSAGQAQTGSTVVSVDGAELTVSSGSGFDVGGGILVNVDGVPTFFEVEAIDGNVLTLDRAVAGTPSGTVAASAHWHTAYDTSVLPHLAFVFESELQHLELLGCAGSASIDFGTDGNFATLQTQLNATTWQTGALASPSVTAPTKGSEVVSLDAQAYIDGTAVDVINCSLDFGIDVQPLPAITTANGHDGYRAAKKQKQLTLNVYYDATLYASLLTGVHDIVFCAGKSNRSACAVRLPAATTKVTRSIVNGQETMTITAAATRRAASVYDDSLHLF